MTVGDNAYQSPTESGQPSSRPSSLNVIAIGAMLLLIAVISIGGIVIDSGAVTASTVIGAFAGGVGIAVVLLIRKFARRRHA